MPNNIFKLLILLVIILFFIFTIKYYISEQNISFIKKNRDNLETKILENNIELPVLHNDTNEVIKFNSGFKKMNEKSFKRNFWELFK